MPVGDADARRRQQRPERVAHDERALLDRLGPGRGEIEPRAEHGDVGQPPVVDVSTDGQLGLPDRVEPLDGASLGVRQRRAEGGHAQLLRRLLDGRDARLALVHLPVDPERQHDVLAVGRRQPARDVQGQLGRVGRHDERRRRGAATVADGDERADTEGQRLALVVHVGHPLTLMDEC